MAQKTSTTIKVDTPLKDEADGLLQGLEEVVGAQLRKGDFYNKIFEAGLKLKKEELRKKGIID